MQLFEHEMRPDTVIKLVYYNPSWLNKIFTAMPIGNKFHLTFSASVGLERKDIPPYDGFVFGFRETPSSYWTRPDSTNDERGKLCYKHLYCFRYLLLY